ncbi:MAG: hypothetical protein TR69_WS6001000641 [candidate division WS6 bacterium OLB20]|uniref:Uncharacterized protein n=1 Tax=candidate division WS6 bacterium OLB20 TaxID=1617426 RepID=A0A136LY87_9BACT|nr:MAG: hypothetical protein TR69_WS6001000641 [candidate division WS6 bacterium OLB20]
MLAVIAEVSGDSIRDVLIDTRGLWYLLARSAAEKDNPLFFVHADELQPQLTWLGSVAARKRSGIPAVTAVDSEGTERTLLLEEHRSGLFDLGGSGYTLDSLPVRRHVYCAVHPFPDLERLSAEGYERWWREAGLNLMLQGDRGVLTVPSCLTGVTAEAGIYPGSRYALSHNLSKGSTVKTGEKIGSLSATDLRMYVSEHSLIPYLRVSDGEYVTTGQELALEPVARGLWAKPVKAGGEGRVDLSLADRGILLIENEHTQQFYAPFGGKITGTSGKKGFRLMTENLLMIPVHTSTGEQFEGTVVADMYTKTVGPRILIASDLNSFDVPLEDIVENSISGVLLLEADYTQLLHSLATDPRWRWCSFALVSAPDTKADSEITDLLYRLTGRYVVAGQKTLCAEMLPAMNGRNQVSDTIDIRQYQPHKGQHVSIFSYYPEEGYARIERATTDVSELLAATDDGFITVSISNTLPK